MITGSPQRPKVASTFRFSSGNFLWVLSFRGRYRGDVAEAVLALKREVGNDLHVLGSTKLVRRAECPTTAESCQPPQAQPAEDDKRWVRVRFRISSEETFFISMR